MNDKIKIRISENAYEKLLNTLNSQTEYSYLRFSYKDGCCRSPKVDLSFDNVSAMDITDKIDNLQIAYDTEVLERINEITLVYRNNSFMVKTIINNVHENKCANCKSNCNKNICKTN